MQRTILTLLLTTLLSTLSACSSSPKRMVSAPSQKENRVLVADGFSKLGNSPHLTHIQNQYSTEQSAKLAAYRLLARQLYQVRLDDNLAVADQVLKNESFRTFFDIFLREAKVIDNQIIANQQKISLALTLTPQFYDCFSSTPAIVSQCLQEDNRMSFTRIGYQQAVLSTVNLPCAASDCSHQLHVSGFSTEKNAWDRSLLNVGLYDSEWTINTGLNAVINYLLITNYLFN